MSHESSWLISGPMNWSISNFLCWQTGGETSVLWLTKWLAEDKRGVMTDRDSVFSPIRTSRLLSLFVLTHITSQENHLWLKRAPFDSTVCWRAPNPEQNNQLMLHNVNYKKLYGIHPFTCPTVRLMTKQPFVPPDSCLHFLLCFICAFVIKNQTTSNNVEDSDKTTLSPRFHSDVFNKALYKMSPLTLVSKTRKLSILKTA